MEQVTAAVNDELVQSLDYKLATSNVNYVQSRKDVNYYPSSLSVFTPTTSRVCRIPLTSGMDFVDGESVKLGFTVRNNSATGTLQLSSPDPSCLIDRVEIFANGTRIEDISHYNRCSYLYSLLKNEEWWLQRHIQGFLADGGGYAQEIAAEGSRHVLMSPHLMGIFNCGKLLPPELNLVLQITFCDPVHGVRSVSASQDYTIENVKLYASQVTLDSALRESFQRIMTSGRSLIFLLPDHAHAAVQHPRREHQLQHHGGPGVHEDARGLRDLQLHGRGPGGQFRISRGEREPKPQGPAAAGRAPVPQKCQRKHRRMASFP